MIRAALLAIAPAGAAHAQASDISRTADGRPDLQGDWPNAFLTPLERIQGAHSGAALRTSV
jgi:hypothetical protein